MAKLTTAEFIDAIKELTVLELNDLVKACEEEFGVSAAAGVVVAAAGAGAAAAGEEKTEFNVELTEVGPNKVKVIKVVRELTGLGLKEAKDLVDGAPKMVKENASKAEADDIKANLDNITTLMVDDIRADKINMRRDIQDSLDRLVCENYVARNGDTYTFLTDDEQDIEREINNIGTICLIL